MNSRLYIVALAPLLLASPALAEPSPSFAWDLNISPATTGAGVAGELCRANPYALYRRGCPDEFNLGPERSDSQRLSALDQFVLFVDHHKSLALDTSLHGNAKLKFTVGLVNVYEQEAEARLSLRIPF